jgi:hypothetical protein
MRRLLPTKNRNKTKINQNTCTAYEVRVYTNDYDEVGKCKIDSRGTERQKENSILHYGFQVKKTGLIPRNAREACFFVFLRNRRHKNTTFFNTALFFTFFKKNYLTFVF